MVKVKQAGGWCLAADRRTFAQLERINLEGAIRHSALTHSAATGRISR